MRKSCFFILVCVLVGSVSAEVVQIPADVSCRAEINSPNTNRHDSSKLSIRGDASSAKSWIKWTDLDGIDASTIRKAELRLTANEARPGTFDVSAVNDNCLDTSIGRSGTMPLRRRHTESPGTNAPANDIASYTNPDFTKATKVGTMDFLNTVAGDQRFIDVTAILQADTDGVVQFILHNSSGLMNMCTHDHPLGAAYYPTLFLTLPPAGADMPNPAVGEIVLNTLSSLSWTSPEPNTPGDLILCDVYLGTFPEGTEPNRPEMYSVLGISAETVSIAAFQGFGGFVNNTKYTWFVDCHDPDKGLIEGEPWDFFVGSPPVVDGGADIVTWLADTQVTVNIDATVTDDGVCTYAWTAITAGAPAPSPADAVDTSIVFTSRGVYEYRLTATDDGGLQGSDTVRIVIGTSACDASHLDTGAAYNAADVNQDCIVDLEDFIELIAADWLTCTDTLRQCQD
jgi:hypothetical protein